MQSLCTSNAIQLTPDARPQMLCALAVDVCGLGNGTYPARSPSEAMQAATGVGRLQ